jgi:hypothetical protein
MLPEPAAADVENRNLVLKPLTLVNLRFLGISECGEVESLAPIGSLDQLEVLYAWGSTRIVDGDLSPLARLPRLKELSVRDRRDYKPRVADLLSALANQGS